MFGVFIAIWFTVNGTPMHTTVPFDGTLMQCALMGQAVVAQELTQAFAGKAVAVSRIDCTNNPGEEV